MADLLIRFSKKRNGATVLSCVRSDGTSTWQRQQGSFFALHDLTHYAVETTLGLRLGFYGLLASGWDITDFGTPWPRGAIPLDAVEDAALAESVTGMLDMERATGVAVSTADCNRWVTAQFEQVGMTLHRPLTDVALAQIRSRFAELAARWQVLPPGDSLELSFRFDN